MVENTTITIQIPKALKKKTESKAKKEGMSMSFYIRQAIKKAVK